MREVAVGCDVDFRVIEKTATGTTRPRIFAKMYKRKSGSDRLDLPLILKEKNQVDYNAIVTIG
jgi:hypothetical protein